MMDLEEETPVPNEQRQEMQRMEVAARLLMVVWKSIDPDYKSQYRAEIWRQFEERIATAARMTPTLQKFLSRLSGMLRIAALGMDEEGRAYVMDTLHGVHGDTDELLQIIRTHPQLCAVQVRVWNDQEKEMRASLSQANMKYNQDMAKAALIALAFRFDFANVEQMLAILEMNRGRG